MTAVPLLDLRRPPETFRSKDAIRASQRPRLRDAGAPAPVREVAGYSLSQQIDSLLTATGVDQVREALAADVAAR